MTRKESISSNLTAIFNLLTFEFKKLHQKFKYRRKFVSQLLINKYIANYKNIIIPFKEKLPLIKYFANPILEEGKLGEWDETGVGEPFILFNGKQYFLYYESCTNSKEKDWQIGVAIAEKISGPWKKHPENPILRYTNKDGDYDKQCVADPCIIYYNGKYHMFFDMFDGKTWRIGKAYSSDGITWKKLKKNGKTSIILDISKKDQWDNKIIHCPEVYLWNNRFHMLYGAVGTGHFDYDTGLAIQIDENGEIFKKICQVTNDEMFDKGIIISRMQAGFILKGIIISGLRIKKKRNETTYMVFSDDGGKSWFKLTGPILSAGNHDDWDSKLFYGPNCWIISENKLWTAYLGGKNDNIRKLGLAYMEIPNL